MDRKPFFMESIVIEAPKELIFSIVESGDTQREWMKGLIEGRVIYKTSDLIGTEFEEIIDIESRRHVLHGRILAYEKDHILKVSLDEDELEFKLEYDVERLERNKSLLILKCWLIDSFNMKMLVKLYLEKKLEKQLENIKKVSEERYKDMKKELQN